MSTESKCNSCNNKNIKCDVCNATSDIYNHHPCYQPKPQTNFEKITSSVESLAEYITKQYNCDDCDKDKRKCKKLCKQELIAWLNKECE